MAWGSTLSIVLRTATSGVITGIMLAFARIAGETAMPLNRVLTRDSRTDAVVLAMTRQPPNMVTMFGSEQMKKLIRLLRDNCDMVVVDCARASAPETWLLARMSDATLMVSRRGVLNTPILAKSLEILTAAKVAPLGLIVTR